jgi:hypothetical protein
MNGQKLQPLALFILGMSLAVPHQAQTPSDSANPPQRDGAHDFDFLIGDWKAHVRRLPHRLNNSNVWVEYDGILNDHETPGGNAHLEALEVTSTDKKLHAKGQRLYVYNPTLGQWSIQVVVNNGALSLPFAVGSFHGNRGEFFGHDKYKGRAILLRYVWTNVSARSAGLEKAFSPDGGKTWEVNWVCELSR